MKRSLVARWLLAGSLICFAPVGYPEGDHGEGDAAKKLRARDREDHRKLEESKAEVESTKKDKFHLEQFDKLDKFLDAYSSDAIDKAFPTPLSAWPSDLEGTVKDIDQIIETLTKGLLRKPASPAGEKKRVGLIAKAEKVKKALGRKVNEYNRWAAKNPDKAEFIIHFLANRIRKNRARLKQIDTLNNLPPPAALVASAGLAHLRRTKKLDDKQRLSLISLPTEENREEILKLRGKVKDALVKEMKVAERERQRSGSLEKGEKISDAEVRRSRVAEDLRKKIAKEKPYLNERQVEEETEEILKGIDFAEADYADANHGAEELNRRVEMDEHFRTFPRREFERTRLGGQVAD